VPESRTAIFVERSLDSIVSLLAALKAGGGYVPMETLGPPERLSLVLNDAKPTVVMTRGTLAERLPENAGILNLDTDWDAICRQPVTNLDSFVQPGNIAYVIYTSGSTGQPKGVTIEHRQLLNYLFSIQSRLQFPPQASFATVSTFAADLGNTMVFPSLVSGGSLHIISQECIADAEALSTYFQRHNIDCLKIVPSHLESLLSCGRAQPTESIPLPRRRLILGGEPTRGSWITHLSALAPDCAIFNHYGPTETCVGVLTYQFGSEQDHQECETLPLGRPLANTRIYIVDSHLQPVGVWSPGELNISGHNVGRGYLNSPDRTAEKFIPDPFAAEPGARLYRSGDLVRCLPSGAIEFIGRIDHQLKLRGFRIELGEVRAALFEHPSVRDVVVTVREDQPGEKRLVAYVVPAQKPGPSATDLRAFLRQKLPEYSIPSAFVVLATIPLTPNGKIDERSLPSPEEAQAEQARPYVAPRTPLEEVLAAIWKEILKVERVGVLDNFFELGGHSLLAMRVVSRLRETFRIDLSLRMLFEQTCVEQLAKALTSIESKPGQVDNIAQVLLRVKGMSAEAVRATLESKRNGRSL
jgi:amino acid adenylation domain-containing protein